MKTIVHLEIAKTGMNLSGGEVCMIELIKHYCNLGYKNILVTTDNGRDTYTSLLPKSENIQIITINSYRYEKKLGIFLSYLARLFLIGEVLEKLNMIRDSDLIICHSEFFPNSILNWRILRKKPTVHSGAFYHMRAPSLFRGYEGEYTGRYQLPRLVIVHYLLNQKLYKYLMRQGTVIYTVNKYYKNFLQNEYPKNRIVVLENYGNHSQYVPVKMVDKVYDILWVGRFHQQKGLYDFIEVIKLIHKYKPYIKVAIVGDGEGKIKANAVKLVHSFGLSGNIEFLGFLKGKEKDDIYRCSRIFAMTSHYESFGLVILEAMSAGLPVVSYDLPVYDVFGAAIKRITILDMQGFAVEVLNLLDDSNLYAKTQSLSLAHAKDHTWVKTGDSILEAHYKLS